VTMWAIWDKRKSEFWRQEPLHKSPKCCVQVFTNKREAMKVIHLSTSADSLRMKFGLERPSRCRSKSDLEIRRVEIVEKGE